MHMHTKKEGEKLRMEKIERLIIIFLFMILVTSTLMIPVYGLMTRERLQELVKQKNEQEGKATMLSPEWEIQERQIEEQEREQTEKEYNSMMREIGFYNLYIGTLKDFMNYYQFVGSTKERQGDEEFETVINELMNNDTYMGETEVRKEFKQMFNETNEMREKPELEHQWFKETVIKILERELEVTKFKEQKENLPREIQWIRETEPSDLYFKFMLDPVIEYRWDSFEPETFESLKSRW
jgi:hypothetical protein